MDKQMNPIINLHNVDCLPAMKEMADNQYDLCITDPPYGADINYNTYEDTNDNWHRLMNVFIPEAIRVSKMIIMSSCGIGKLEWIYKNHPPDWLICWYKGSPGQFSKIGFNDWEALLVYGRTKNLSMHDYFYVRPDEKMGNHNHPCPKPILWYKWLITRSLPNGGHVVDFFSGAGTGGIACWDLGYDFTGYEIDKDYYNASLKRLETHKKRPQCFFKEKDVFDPDKIRQRRKGIF